MTHFCTHTYVVSCGFLILLNVTFHKPSNSDSSPFNSDDSPSDDESSQQTLMPSNTSNYNCPTSSSNNQSPIKPIYNSPSKQIIRTPHTDILIDRPRHISQNQPNIHPPPIDRTTKTHYPLRRQPQMDYRLIIPPSKLYK